MQILASRLFLNASSGLVDVHRGSVLPEARVIVIAVPLVALCFYFFVVRRHRDR